MRRSIRLLPPPPGPLASRRSRRLARGFSLIEVMIVLAVIALVASLVVPMASDVESARLRSAARLLVADLQYAQLESMAHADDPRVVVFDTMNDEYLIAAASDTTTPITNRVDDEPYLVRFGTGRASDLAGVVISSHDLDGDDQVGFGKYGQLDQVTSATITLSVSGRTITITLDPINGEASVGPVT